MNVFLPLGKIAEGVLYAKHRRGVAPPRTALVFYINISGVHTLDGHDHPVHDVAGIVLEGIRHQQDEATRLKETMTGLSPVRRLPAVNLKESFEEFL